jgi:hypothetical protein
MAIIKIDDIYLYTDIQEEKNEQTESVDAKAFMDSLDIKYTNLNYPIPEEHHLNFVPLGTWVFADGQHVFEKFPFVIYTEIHDDLSPAYYPRVLLYGLNEIKDSNLLELYSLGR